VFAVSYLHRENVVSQSIQNTSVTAATKIATQVHGDLKGVSYACDHEAEQADTIMCLKDNVLVAADGTLKLTDFGLAVMQDSMMQFSETDPGGGTARWMVCLTCMGIFGDSLTYIT
jgi:serine/threonine protein kinase